MLKYSTIYFILALLSETLNYAYVLYRFKWRSKRRSNLTNYTRKKVLAQKQQRIEDLKNN